MIDTLFTGQSLKRFQTLSSTNDLAMALLSEGLVEGTVILAEFQERGRGQKGQAWHSRPGENIMMSLIYYPRFLPLTHLFPLSKAVALGLRQCVAHFLPEAEVQIKWPNDLLINRKKVAGILIENQLDAKGLKASVIGIGLNVNQEHFPENIAGTATSLRAEGDVVFEREHVLHQLFSRLEQHYLQLKSKGAGALDATYLQHLYGYQELVGLRFDGQETEGMIMGVNQAGHLGVKLGKNLRYFDLKEVQFIL